MFTRKPFIGDLLFVLFLITPALGQENRAPIDTPREPVAAGPLVTATASAKRVRFVSPGSVVQLRLEVYNDAGQKLFDTELRGGNVLDWPLQDGAGERLPTGSYACLLTTKSLSGRLSQRVGLVTVNGEKAAVEAAGEAQFSLAQQQAIGPVEGHATFTVLAVARPSGRAQTDSVQKPQPQSEAEAITTVTHDGNDGQMTRTRGALSFRMGDVFAGKDKEQMRLSEEGNLGIGTSKPQAKLDVAGMIRARAGFMFSDGSTLKVNEKGVLTRTNADGSDLKSTTATTQNKIAKFTDNLGTVGDSVITESLAGNIGIGTATPQSLLQVGPHPGYGSTTGILITNNLIGSQYDRAFQLAPRQTASPATNSILMYALPTVNTGVTVPSQYGVFVDGKRGTGTVTSYAAIATGQVANLGATNNTHLLLGNLAIPTGNYAIYDNTRYRSYFHGSVGIGTTNPTAKLDVVGSINTSTQYNIGGERVLSMPGNNLFAGKFAGADNTTGVRNTFAGEHAGYSNTSGNDNAYFGLSAGLNDETGSNNSYFGSLAGATIFGSDNSFFGHRTGYAALVPTFGDRNSLFGSHAGGRIVNADDNAFFGYFAGRENRASDNSFFGSEAGSSNESGIRNAFFGRSAGLANVSGGDNTLVGFRAGDNSTGGDNSFLGSDAGGSTTSGSGNTFVGSDAGDANTTGGNNTVLGNGADVATGALNFATAIGAGAIVFTNNTVVIGRSTDTVSVPGTLSKAAGSFKIDHPLDPANKTLSHSFVESPDMMNVYNGNTTTDQRGFAVVTLPNYFEALNRDFRYQLTVIGRFAQAIVLEEIKGNRFCIKTNRPRVKVSWQVTGVRQDAYAEAHRIPTEELKPDRQRGTYLHPDAFAPKRTARSAGSAPRNTRGSNARASGGK